LEIAITYGQSSKMEEIRKWYASYNFGGTEVYNPWSITSYFSHDCTPETYWLNTSNNQLTFDMLKSSTPEIKHNLNLLSEGESINCEIEYSIVFNDLKTNPESIWSFLLSAGYLKIDQVNNSASTWYSVSVPNREIASLFKDIVLSFAE
jgi:hypothetical protein